MVERIFWFCSIVFMAVVLMLTSLSKDSNTKVPSQENAESSSVEESTSKPDTATKLETFDTQNESTETPTTAGKMQLASIPTLTGYSVMTDLRARYITIAKDAKEGSLNLEFEDKGNTPLSEFIPAQDSGKKVPRLYELSNGWEYYYSDGWDSKPGTKTIANIRRVFLHLKDGRLVVAYQYDYTGGRYDKEIEKIVEGTIIAGEHW